MKQVLLSTMLLLMATFVGAQDMIVSKSGEVIMGYNLEISESAIFYNVSESRDSDLKRLSRSEILIIQKKDGTKIDLDSGNAAGKPAAAEVQPVKSIGAEDGRNAERIAEMNAGHISLTKSDESKNVMMMMVDYSVSPESVLENKDISVTLGKPEHLLLRTNQSLVLKPVELVLTKSMWEYYDCGPVIIPVIKNKSDKVIYLDLGRSYYVAGGKSHTLYTATVSTEAKSTAIAGGIGFLGSASASSTAETKVEQRVISIPPMASVTLEGYYFSPDATIQKLLMYLFGNAYPKDIKKRYLGQYTDISSYDVSPYSVSFFFTYSFDDSFANETASLRASFTPRGVLSMGSKVLGDYIEMSGFQPGASFYFPAYQHPYTDIWDH